MESLRVTRNDPESENRLSLGGRKRSSRRSSILKTSKSPMKALEERDPNSLVYDKENRDKKSRRSSSRRVSFAQTYEVKEFCNEDGFNEWGNSGLPIQGQNNERDEYLPSEYRQPSVTIKGLESLLNGDIQNTMNTDQLSCPDMDFTTLCHSTFNEQCEPNLNRTVGFSQDSDLDITCHGQGLIVQENRVSNKPSCFDNMDLTACHYKTNTVEIIEESNRTVVYSNTEMNALDLTCHGQGTLSIGQHQPTDHSASSFLNSLAKQEPEPKLDASGFLLSLSAKKPSREAVKQKDMDDSFSSRAFLENLVAQSPSNEEGEEMEMTACLEVPLETTNKMPISDENQGDFYGERYSEGIQRSQSQHEKQSDGNIRKPFSLIFQGEASSRAQGRLSSMQGEQMDMTACVPSSLRPQGHPAMQEAQMDMTACIPASLRPQGHPAMQEAQMDMTACMPASLKPQGHPAMQEAQMDMTACIPASLRPQGHPTMQEAQMDMTACIPASLRPQGHPTMQEAQMDMTACIPTSLRPQGHPTMQEAQMDMTACIPASLRPQGHPTMQEAQMDMTACIPTSLRPQGHPTMQEAQMDTTACIPASLRPQGHPAMQEAQMDMTACIPASLRPQGHSIMHEEKASVLELSRSQPHVMQEGEMDMTTCVPISARPQGCYIMQDAEMDMTAYLPPLSTPKAHTMFDEVQMDITTCVPPTSKTQGHQIQMDPVISSPTSSSPQDSVIKEVKSGRESEKTMLSKQSLNSLEKETSKCEFDNLEERAHTSMTQHGIEGSHMEASSAPSHSTLPVPPEKPSNDSTYHEGSKRPIYNFKENFSQSLMSRTLPLLGSQRTKKSSFQSLPALSSFILQPSAPSETDPQITFGPTCDIPISQFCSHAAKKQKTAHDDSKDVSTTNEQSLERINGGEPNVIDAGHTGIVQKESIPSQETMDSSHRGKETFSEKQKQLEHSMTFNGNNVHPGSEGEANNGLTDNNTYVLDQQAIQNGKEDHGGNTSPRKHVSKDENTFRPTTNKDHTLGSGSEEATPEKVIDSHTSLIDDAEISFKDASMLVADPEVDMEEDENRGKETPLMDEPTLEFASDVSDEHETFEEKACNSKAVAVAQPKDDTFVLGRKKPNLSIISEEIEAVENKNASYIGQKETPVERKKMTVTELLKQANISFNFAMQQSSRQSVIFGALKQKPKEDSEFLQLSLAVKPQAQHYGEFCTHVKKDFEELKTKMNQQQQELNSMDLPILYYKTEDEMTQLAIKLKNLKRTVCKEKAIARWIEKSGVMKKKLVSVLKNNCSDVKSDIAILKDSVAVAQECGCFLDDIDKELDKEIKNFKEQLEKTHKDCNKRDDIQATFEQKTSELNSKESELQQLEQRRSELISSKERLTAEKANLEKQEFDSKELLEKAEQELSAKEDEEKIWKEKYDMMGGCLEWKLAERPNDNHAKFLYLQETLEILVTFETEKCHISSKFAHSLIQNSVDLNALMLMSPTFFSLHRALDHVSNIVCSARTIADELFDVCFNCMMSVSSKENSICLEFSSLKAFMKFFIELTIDVKTYPTTHSIGFKVIPRIGQIKYVTNDIEF